MPQLVSRKNNLSRKVKTSSHFFEADLKSYCYFSTFSGTTIVLNVSFTPTMLTSNTASVASSPTTMSQIMNSTIIVTSANTSTSITTASTTSTSASITTTSESTTSTTASTSTTTTSGTTSSESLFRRLIAFFKGEKADLGFSDFSRFFEIFSDFSGFQRTIILGENDVFFTQIFRP